MATYLELKAQAEKLMQQAEELRLRERNEIIAKVKEEIKTHGLTAQDLGMGRAAGGGVRKARASQAAASNPAEVKYRGPQGEVWSGGRGRKPNWVLAILNAGKDIEQYRVAASKP